MVLPRLQTARGVIRLPEPADAPKLLQYRLENREHLASWEPSREASYFALDQCRRAAVDAREVAELDRGYPLVLLDPDEQEIRGSVALSNVMRGPFQACLLGYGIGTRWQGQGLLSGEGLGRGCGRSELQQRSTLQLRASHVPSSGASRHLLTRKGTPKVAGGRKGHFGSGSALFALLGAPCKCGGHRAATFAIARAFPAQALAAGR